MTQRWGKNLITWTVTSFWPAIQPPNTQARYVPIPENVQLEYVRRGIEFWSTVCGLRFEYDPDNADIEVAWEDIHLDNPPYPAAYGGPDKSAPDGTILHGRIVMNNEIPWDEQGIVGAILHEAGHCHGFDHPTIYVASIPGWVDAAAIDVKTIYGPPAPKPPTEEHMGRYEIVPGLIYLDRSAWGSDPLLPRLGNPEVPRSARTRVITHHVAAIDNDATPNLWESEEEIKVRMRGLQRARPDLGLDVPYNFVAFPMADGSLIVCEGRGEDLSGAHTRWWNVDGIAMSWYGDFTSVDYDLSPYLRLASYFWGWLRYDPNFEGYGGPYEAMSNLGSVKPAPARLSYGHRDAPDAGTSCPGDALYAALYLIEFLNPADYAEGDDDMPDPRISDPMVATLNLIHDYFTNDLPHDGTHFPTWVEIKAHLNAPHGALDLDAIRKDLAEHKVQPHDAGLSEQRVREIVEEQEDRP